MLPTVAVSYSQHILHACAEDLAARLSLPLLETSPVQLKDPPPHLPPWLLQWTEQRLQLVQTGPKAPGPIYPEWAEPGSHKRGLSVKTELVAKAAGLKPGYRPLIWDLTAGLGRDAFVLAALGCKVILIERSPILHALLENALMRALNTPHVSETAQRMTLVHADASHWLKTLSAHEECADTLYIDPMYPHRKKSALVKKEMRALRDVVGDDPDSGDLLPLAQSLAGRRVVVKRPKLAETLTDTPPDLVYPGKHTRFDVYLNTQSHTV
jgi:16S rRNA (guanine1516-N2)-methyltransferase